MVGSDEVCGGLREAGEDFGKVEIFCDFPVQLVQSGEPQCALFGRSEERDVPNRGTQMARDGGEQPFVVFGEGIRAGARQSQVGDALLVLEDGNE